MQKHVWPTCDFSLPLVAFGFDEGRSLRIQDRGIYSQRRKHRGSTCSGEQANNRTPWYVSSAIKAARKLAQKLPQMMPQMLHQMLPQMLHQMLSQMLPNATPNAAQKLPQMLSELLRIGRICPKRVPNYTSRYGPKWCADI